MVLGFDARFAAVVADLLETDFSDTTLLGTPLSDQPARIRYAAPLR